MKKTSLAGKRWFIGVEVVPCAESAWTEARSRSSAGYLSHYALCSKALEGFLESSLEGRPSATKATFCVQVTSNFHIALVIGAHKNDAFCSQQCGVYTDGRGCWTRNQAHVRMHATSQNQSLVWRLLCRSFLVMPCFLIGDYNMLPKKEQHRSLRAWSDLLETLKTLATLRLSI